MPSHLKKLVRERMARTGESYQTALREVRKIDPRAAGEPPSGERGFGVLPGTDIAGPIYEGAPCIVCREEVKPGEGAPCIPPMPALHSKCIPVAMAKLKAAGHVP